MLPVIKENKKETVLPLLGVITQLKTAEVIVANSIKNFLAEGDILSK